MSSIISNLNTVPETQDASAGITDEHLNISIILAKQGDIKAFKTLYQEYLSMVYGLCFRLCADKSQAEDATQEVFIQLWQKIHNFDEQSKFSTWLHSVASNVCISYIRRQKGWWQKVFQIVDDGSHEQAAFGDFNVDEFEVMVLRLPERTRLVFVLYAIEGYRHEQIAQMLSISVNTSKVQLHRARGLIEEWINE